MKNCQEIKKENKKYIKKYLFFVLIFIFILVSFSYSKTVYAATPDELAGQLNANQAKIKVLEAQIEKAEAQAATSIKVSDQAQIAGAKVQLVQLNAEQNRLYDLLIQANKKWSWEKL